MTKNETYDEVKEKGVLTYLPILEKIIENG